MPFTAKVAYALIASPGDTADERRLVRQIIEDWNALHGESGLVYLPLIWERDAIPEMGDRPQGIINRQLVDRADMLIGLFWTRLGTRTSEGDSGTAEEINRCIGQDKPVAVYFSEMPIVPASVDLEEYQRLKHFRSDLQQRGLIDTYADPDDLLMKVHALLTRLANDRFRVDTDNATPGKEGGPSTIRGAQLLAQVDTEREMRGFSRSGKPQYTTRHQLVLQNVGSVTVTNLRLEFQAPNALPQQLPQLRNADDPVGAFPPGASISFPMLVHMGTVAQCDLIMTWSENSQERSATQTIRIF
jgi:nucleoside 2-deoxyribosyltransferase